MTKKAGILALAALLAGGVLLDAAPAGAVWLLAGGGWNTYAMSDVNGDIDAIAAAIAPVSIKDISGGADLELGAGAPVARWLDAGVAYERLWASASPSQGSDATTYHLPAEVFKATLWRTFPSSSPDRLGFAIGLGIVRLTGADIRNVDVGTSVGQGDVSGSGLFAEGALTSTWRISGPLSLAASLGYRYARIGKVEVGGQTAYRGDGQQYAIDYSGLAIRAALRVDVWGKRQNPEPTGERGGTP